MYNRYIRNQNGDYVCHPTAEPQSGRPRPPEPSRGSSGERPSSGGHGPAVRPAQPDSQPSGPPPLFQLGQRALDTDDLLIAAILVLLLRDGEELDWTSLLAGFFYLFL